MQCYCLPKYTFRKSHHWLLNTGLFVKELGQNTELSAVNSWGGDWAIKTVKDEIHMKNVLQETKVLECPLPQ